MEDITGLGEVATAAASIANNFIDKISHAAGVLYNDSGCKMKKDSFEKACSTISQSADLDEFTKLAIISNLKQDLKHYNNQRSIIQKAIIDDDINVNDVDDDWLLFFFDRAKNISSEEMQNVWARMLSEEFNKPRSIPKSLLHTVSCIEKEYAIIFNELCKFVVYNRDELFVVIPYKQMKNFFIDRKITLNNLMELEKYGLIKYNNDGFTIRDSKTSIEYSVNKHRFILKTNSEKELVIGNVIFTYDGEVLCKCIREKQSENLEDVLCVLWKNIMININE